MKILTKQHSHKHMRSCAQRTFQTHETLNLFVTNFQPRLDFIAPLLLLYCLHSLRLPVKLNPFHLMYTCIYSRQCENEQYHLDSARQAQTRADKQTSRHTHSHQQSSNVNEFEW